MKMERERGWAGLEFGRLADVSAVWRTRLGGQWAAFQASFLERTRELASHYPCPRDCGCAHEVVREGDAFVAVCRCESWSCDAFALSAEDLAMWRLSWARLGRALCAALGLDPRPGTVDLPRTRQVGSWSAAAVPVLVTIPGGGAPRRAVIADLSARLRRPYILLAPTSRHLDAAGIERLSDAGAGFFDLESIVAFGPDVALRPLRAPGELFARFTPEPPETDRSVVERAFALVKALDTSNRLREPSLVAVFSHYCLEGLTVSRIARRFGCSRGTVLNRLELIRRRTRTDPDRFRRLSPHLAGVESSLADPRARSIYRKGAIYGEEEQEV